MCGIVGIIGKSTDKEQVIQKMLDKQKHRGPDAKDFWNGNEACFGHNRLSIIDLNSNANQPMVSNEGRYVIVFNGEIYNYKELKNTLKNYSFKTQSDTEVLLALYIQKGKEMLNELNGMFSFAIWDRTLEGFLISFTLFCNQRTDSRLMV